MGKAFLLIIILILASVYFFLFRPALKDLNLCLDSQDKSIEQAIAEAKSGNSTREQRCVKAKEYTTIFAMCIKRVETRQILAPLIMDVTGSRKKYLNMYRFHDQSCPEFPLEIGQ